MKKHIEKIKGSSSLIKDLDALVNASIKANCVFSDMYKFHKGSDTDEPLYKVINYTLDTFLEGYTKHESLMSGYILMSSGIDIAENFKCNNFTNPYIDGEYLDDIWDDEE